MPSPQTAAVFAHLRLIASITAAGSGGGLASTRRMTDIFANVSPDCGRLVTSVTPGEVAGRPAEWHTTPGADPNRRLLYLHGGGWLAGSLGSHRSLVSSLTAATGGVTLAIDYRLAPEHPFPAGLDDCVAAYRWLCEHGPNGAGAAGSTAVAGDSAGGNLALATLLSLRDAGGPLPDAAAVLSPVTDLSGEGESHASRKDLDPIMPAGPRTALFRAYTGGAAEFSDPRINLLGADLRGLPPLLVQVGDAEVLRSDSVRLAERARAAGVDVQLEVWADMPHVFPLFTHFLPEADEAIARIAAFLGEHRRAG